MPTGHQQLTPPDAFRWFRWFRRNTPGISWDTCRSRLPQPCWQSSGSDQGGYKKKEPLSSDWAAVAQKKSSVWKENGEDWRTLLTSNRPKIIYHNIQWLITISWLSHVELHFGGPPFLGKPVHNLILVGVVLNPLKQSRGIHRFINQVSKVAKQLVHFFRAMPRTFGSIHGRPEWRRRFEDLVSSHWCSLRRFQRWDQNASE